MRSNWMYGLQRIANLSAGGMIVMSVVLGGCGASPGGGGGGGQGDGQTTDGEDPDDPSADACNVAFCEQVDHYENGYGHPGVDTITVDCVAGPAGATVSNARNGEYTITGTYTLDSYDTAKIELAWGGSTTYVDFESFTISEKGSGEFSIRVVKESGGSGNLFLTMSSGSNWMFNTVLVNEGCTSNAVPSADN